MATFEADPAALLRLGHLLLETAEALGARHPARSIAGVVASAPEVDATGELARCVGTCRQLEDLMTEATRELARRLVAAAEVYEAADVLLAGTRPPT